MPEKRKLRLYDEDANRKVAEEMVQQDTAGPEGLRPTLSRILKQYPSLMNATLYLVQDPRELAGTPTDPAARELLASKIREDVDEEMKLGLSRSDFELYQRAGMASSDPARQRIAAAMDRVILRMAEEDGYRIMILAPAPVTERLSQWEFDGRDGPRMWKKLGGRLARRAQILAGAAKGPLEWWAPRASAIRKELKILRDGIGNKFDGRIQDNRALLDLVDDALGADAASFPTLVEIGTNLHLFIQAHPKETRSFFDRQLTPALFRDQLIGVATNREPESARQVRSRIFNKPRVRFKGNKT
jgi:hypothetical protein